MRAIECMGTIDTFGQMRIDEELLWTARGEFLGAHQCADALAVVGHNCIHTERFVGCRPL